MLDPSGNITTWNAGAEKIKGYTADEVLGKHVSIFYSPEDIKKGICDYELKEAALTGRFETEGWRFRKDGTMFWANVIISAVRDQSKRLLGFAKVTRDLTERRRAELVLQESFQNLENQVQERTALLATANEQLLKRERELEEAVNIREEFLQIASHELKTPLTSLKMQIQILKQKSSLNNGIISPEKLAKTFASSLNQVDRMTRLIEDLLDVTRAQSKKLTLNFEPTDFCDLILEVCNRLTQQLATSQNTIDLDLEDSIVGNFDRFRLDQVLVNLLTNAGKYAEGSPIRVKLSKRDGVATLIVEDQGPGIPQEFHQKVFERFGRGQNSRNVGGLGLGLYICKEIVENHHGSIRVENVNPKGSRFIVELPLNMISVNERDKFKHGAG